MPKEAPEWRARLANGYDGAMTAGCDRLLAEIGGDTGRRQAILADPLDRTANCSLDSHTEAPATPAFSPPANPSKPPSDPPSRPPGPSVPPDRERLARSGPAGASDEASPLAPASPWGTGTTAAGRREALPRHFPASTRKRLRRLSFSVAGLQRRRPATQPRGGQTLRLRSSLSDPNARTRTPPRRTEARLALPTQPVPRPPYRRPTDTQRLLEIHPAAPVSERWSRHRSIAPRFSTA